PLFIPLSSPPEQPAHLFSQVFFCQEDAPLYGLAQTLDNDLLFWYDFPGARWRSRRPDFPPETQLSEAQIEAQKKICDAVLPVLTDFSDTYIEAQFPEARGIPQVEVFTLRPLVLGQPNVLVCSARNIFPPVARIEWAYHGQPLTRGVSSTPVFPVEELDFQVFSYVEVTPQAGDIYSCTVKGKTDSLAYWVPRDPVASKLLENILCGLAVAVGGVFTIVGVVLLVLSCRARSAD
ncbi:class II histocompatibility antigen, M alpha chain, partial [Pseudonaja textilis]|uniref:class II histocompatibility antigen, M alpha chain n=1 Tax=Pseudonaja textilis TaxID=8673 RepID=UPI000EA9F108